MSAASAVRRTAVAGQIAVARFWLPSVLVLLSAAIPWGWVPGGHVIAGIDTPPNVDFAVLLKTTLHTWDAAPNGGISNFVGYGMFFPYFMAGAWLQQMGATPHFITIGALSFAFALGALGFYCLCDVLGADRLLSALLTIGYTLNLSHTFMAPGAAALFAYAALPWIPLAAVWAARSRTLIQISIGLMFGVASLGLIYIKINPPTYVATFVGGIVLALLALRARSLRLPIPGTLAFAAAYFLVNLWWIADFVLGLHIDPAAVTVKFNLAGVSAASTLAQVLLLGGSWAFGPQFDSSPYFVYASWYRSEAIQVLLALAPAGAILTLVLFRRYRSALWTLAAIALFAFFNAGDHPPFGFAFLWAFEHVPYFWLYREPLTKFDTVLALIYLCSFVFVVPQIADAGKRRIAMMLVAAATVGFVVGGVPLADGAVVRPAAGTAPSFKVRVPTYWRQFGRWANAQNGGRIAMLPENHHYELLYDWGYLGADIDGMLLRHPFIDITPSAGYTDAGMKGVELEWYAALSRSESRPQELRALTDALGIEYVVVRHDVLPTLLSPHLTPESVYLPRLQAIGFHYVRRFGQIDVYARNCCSNAYDAILRPAALTYTNAKAVGAWYPVHYSDAIFSPSSLAATGERMPHKAWRATSDLVFGLRGVRSATRVGVDVRSAFGTTRGASFARLRGLHYFIWTGNFTAPIENHRDYLWHSAPGAPTLDGVILGGSPVSAQSVRASQKAGILVVRPLHAACAFVAVRANGDPNQFIPPYAQGLVVPPYSDTFSTPVLLGAPKQISVTACSAGVKVPYVTELYAVTTRRPFEIAPLPNDGAQPVQYGERVVRLNRTQKSQICHGCVLSYAVLSLRAPDFVRVTLNAKRRRQFIVGLIDGRGAIVDGDNLTALGNTIQGPVQAGKLAIACDCVSSRAPTVVVHFGSARRSDVKVANRRAPNMRVLHSSETGSSGTYVSDGEGEFVLPESFSNGWRLTVDGKTVPHFATVTKQNAWVVPAGSHHYRLTFWLEDLGSRLQRVAMAAGAGALILCVVCVVAAVRVRS